MRKIPMKNYFIYLLICLLTFCLIFLFVFRVKKAEIVKHSILSGFLYEIPQQDVIENLNSYVIDNPNFFLYIANHSDEEFEIEFKDYINDNNLKEHIIYFNGWNQLDSTFVSDFKNNFVVSYFKSIDSKAYKQSNIYTYQNGKVVGMLYNKKVKINIEDVKNYIEKYGDKIYD